MRTAPFGVLAVATGLALGGCTEETTAKLPLDPILCMEQFRRLTEAAELDADFLA
jgi:hypothetical protein